MHKDETPMAVTGATRAIEGLKMGVAYLLQFMEPEDFLQALIHLAKLKDIPINEAEFLGLIEEDEVTLWPETIER